jgi:hypothetical protein
VPAGVATASYQLPHVRRRFATAAVQSGIMEHTVQSGIMEHAVQSVIMEHIHVVAKKLLLNIKKNTSFDNHSHPQ